MELQIGSTVGDYQIVGILGAGGMGKVYKVRNVISDRIEAMKVLLPDLAHEPELADRFLREIKVQASLEHANIAALHTAIRVENQLLMLMEFVEGDTLEHRLKDGPLPVAEAVDYIRQALAALDYAHTHGVIHRDIKPANMIVTPAGVLKLMDFGIAKAATDRKLTMTGTTMGSLYYMSPEQIQGAASLDGRSDLYAVGVSLYELVTGKRPFDGDSQFAIMSAHLEKAPVPPVTIDARLPQQLNDVILMSVAKDPNARFQTATAFRNALASIAPQAQPAPGPVAMAAAAAPAAAFGPAAPAAQAARPAAAPGATGPRGKRGLWMAIGGVAAVVVAVAAIQFGPWKGSKAAPQRPPAQTTAAPAPAVSTPAPNPEPVVQQPQQSAAPVKSAAPKGRPAAQTQAAAPPVQAQQPPLQQAAPVQQPPAQAAAPPSRPVETGPSRAELQAAREEAVKLSTRASVIHTSLQSLQRSQAAGGLGLRGDMQEAAGLMDSYLGGAKDALNANDLASSKSFMDKAERQIEKLEKFLGR